MLRFYFEWQLVLLLFGSCLSACGAAPFMVQEGGLVVELVVFNFMQAYVID